MVAQSVLFLGLLPPATGTTTPAPRQGPLNAVTDFGAVPDGGVIDAKSGMVGAVSGQCRLTLVSECRAVSEQCRSSVG